MNVTPTPQTFFLFDVRIDEPMVSLTDLVVAAACFFFALRLWKKDGLNSPQRLYAWYFFTMGIATTFGGLFGHAFLYAVPFEMKLPGWIMSMFSVMLLERATIRHTRRLFKESVVKVLGVVNILEITTFITITLLTLDFLYVEIHAGYGLMVVVLSLEGMMFLKSKNRASGSILLAVAWSALSAVIFMGEISPHPAFNHIALSHVGLFMAAIFFYRGAVSIDMQRDHLVR